MVFFRNNKARKIFTRFIVDVMSAPPPLPYFRHCLSLQTPPVTHVSPFCVPWSVQPGRYWEGHSISTKRCSVKQHIRPRFRSYNTEFFTARDTTSHALKVASGVTCTEGRDRIIRSETGDESYGYQTYLSMNKSFGNFNVGGLEFQEYCQSAHVW
jgi:hypothetical protein